MVLSFTADKFNNTLTNVGSITIARCRMLPFTFAKVILQNGSTGLAAHPELPFVITVMSQGTSAFEKNLRSLFICASFNNQTFVVIIGLSKKKKKSSFSKL